MANSEAGTSSDAARESGGEYQVFLSFRGPDTRHGFSDFLYDGLKDSGFRVFRDDEELRAGDVIGGCLLRAINSSIIYIPVFSETYAVSKWCLRELAHMVDNVSKSQGRKSILPIFFHVEPEVVKLKTPPYADALLGHEEKFPDEVEAWRAALVEVGKIKGLNVKKDKSQVEIVKSIVEEVLEKLQRKQKEVPRHLVRLDAQVNGLIKSLDINQCDVRLLTIYGMGGIGKTTVAKVIYNQLSSHFGKCCSFLEDVRASSLTEEGIVRLQKKLLSDIVGSRFADQVNDSEKGMETIGGALREKEVLVVLDDVAEEQHIECLIGKYSLCSRSRIIITTRDKTIPLDEGFNGEIQRYEMLEMDYSLALQLFCRHALGTDSPPDEYRWLSNEIVSCVGGLPLAIEVIGSSLKRRKNKAIWKQTLDNLKNLPKEKILNKLKISYEGLDKNQKYIFLDIACFFSNKKMTYPIYMWASCLMNPLEDIEVLTERCLIKILDNDKFWMHDQLIALGREIVQQDSAGERGKQSRLWIAEEALEIIRTEERKEKVLALDLDGLDDSIEITNQEFKRLQNLRYLKLGDGTFAGDFAKCRSKLRWISWRCPHQDFRADNMSLDNLVVFKLGANGFTDDSKAWDLIKRAHNLTAISLTECDGITTIPDISKCLGLKRLTLAHCNRLKRIKSFIGHLQLLIELRIEGCTGLTDLPEEVGALVKLNRFSLQGCCELSKLPSSLGDLTSLIELDLSGTGIAGCDLGWIGRLSELKKLDLNLPNMNVLRDLASLSHLEELTVSWQYVKSMELPPSLTYLHIKKCTSLGGLIHPSNKTKTEGGEKAAAWTMKKVVLGLDLHDARKLKMAVETAIERTGADLITVHMERKEVMTVTGAMIDAANLVDKMRRRGFRDACLLIVDYVSEEARHSPESDHLLEDGLYRRN